MRKLICLLFCTFVFSYSAFASEGSMHNVEIKKITSYQIDNIKYTPNEFKKAIEDNTINLIRPCTINIVISVTGSDGITRTFTKEEVVDLSFFECVVAHILTFFAMIFD